jgi:16S rRNA (cytosine967-C5)-methyltransferase
LADPARTAALEVLRAVRAGDAYTNLALPAALKKHGLSGRDAAFATELTSGTVRRQGLYDAVLAACVDRPLAKVQARVLDALRLGAHQLLAMRVPAHAAISTTVALVRSDVGPGAAGFANAVLRRVSERDEQAWVARVAPARADDPVGYLSVAHAHPRWVVEALAEAVGEGEIDALLVADNEAPGVTLVARPGRSTREELPGEPTRWSPYGVHLASGDPGAVAAVAEGRAGVQDEGSQLVALVLASAPLDGPDRRWLDLCAGPGGKAALLAALAAGSGAGLLANERLPHRADLVQRTLRGADGVLGVVTGDGTRPPWPAGSFDRVLVDAPCTGTGTWRRNPDARSRTGPADLRELLPKQAAILDTAAGLVRPDGGRLIYATCSLLPDEDEEQVRAFLARHGDFSPLPLPAAWAEAAGSEPPPGEGEFLLTSPARHGTDGFFAAILQRGT